MREIEAEEIVCAIEKLCIEANCILNDDIYDCIKCKSKEESSEIGKDILEKLIINADIAKENMKPICQDTGMAVVFLEIGQDVHINGNLEKAVNEGVRRGYTKGYLRKSIVKDPINRVNTNDNTPAVIHTNLTEGDKIKITVAPKGFGSENMSRVFMLKPSDGMEGVKKAVLKAIDEAGANPCPPMVVGIGVGGNFEYCAYLAKKALLRKIGKYSENPTAREIEEYIMENGNKLGIGPQGLGGDTTLLWASCNVFPTHIAGLPVAVNISCHVTRHAETIL